MQPRMELGTESSAYRAMFQLERYVRGSGINSTLLQLIKIRASQMNGCAVCIDLHTQAARLNGETEQRIYALNAWQEAPFFTPAERAVLALTESVTSIATNSVSDEIYSEVSHYFTQDEIANLLMAIVTINGWNRIVITIRMVPGSYQSQPLQPQRISPEILSV